MTSLVSQATATGAVAVPSSVTAYPITGTAAPLQPIAAASRAEAVRRTPSTVMPRLRLPGGDGHAAAPAS
ncbi:hypothetical protein [Nonomuraea rubra]|uniref:hypothetical protein n=1 Tax=Nonomuraea rubra TaxID=46180 RepID=UPI0031E68005